MIFVAKRQRSLCDGKHPFLAQVIVRQVKNEIGFPGSAIAPSFFHVRGHSNNTWHFFDIFYTTLSHVSFGDTGMDLPAPILWHDIFTFPKISFCLLFYGFYITVQKGKLLLKKGKQCHVTLWLTPIPSPCNILWYYRDLPPPTTRMSHIIGMAP